MVHLSATIEMLRCRLGMYDKSNTNDDSTGDHARPTQFTLGLGNRFF